jgi:hypothetical protein
MELAPRVERALVVLAAHAQQLDGRLEHIERRLDRVEDGHVDPEIVPTHEDILEVRIHSARVAAELARVTVELRAQIEQVAHAAAIGKPRDQRIATLAEQIIDLSDAFDTHPLDLTDRNDAGRWAAAG